MHHKDFLRGRLSLRRWSSVGSLDISMIRNPSSVNIYPRNHSSRVATQSLSWESSAWRKQDGMEWNGRKKDLWRVIQALMLLWQSNRKTEDAQQEKACCATRWWAKGLRREIGPHHHGAWRGLKVKEESLVAGRERFELRSGMTTQRVPVRGRKEGRKGDEKGEAWNVKEESKNESSAKDAVAITSSPEESTESFRKESFTWHSEHHHHTALPRHRKAPQDLSRIRFT